MWSTFFCFPVFAGPGSLLGTPMTDELGPARAVGLISQPTESRREKRSRKARRPSGQRGVRASRDKCPKMCARFPAPQLVAD